MHLKFNRVWLEPEQARDLADAADALLTAGPVGSSDFSDHVLKGFTRGEQPVFPDIQIYLKKHEKRG